MQRHVKAESLSVNLVGAQHQMGRDFMPDCLCRFEVDDQLEPVGCSTG